MLDLRTEEQLMTAARDGDDDAFRRLTLRFRDRVAGFLRHLGCDAATAEDLAQETLLRLWASRRTYEQRAALMTYVLTIAKNLWLNHAPRQAVARRRTTDCRDVDDFERTLLRAGRQVQGPEVQLLEKYRLFRLRQAILRLPASQRLVFVLAHVEDLAYADVARVLGIAEGTVKSRMYRAVRNLRRDLGTEFAESVSEEE